MKSLRNISPRSTRPRQAAAISAFFCCLAVVWTLAAPPPPAAAASVASGTHLVQCTSGNFRGEARVRTVFNGADSWHPSANSWTVAVESYRISRLNGQSGGNKANLNMRSVTHTDGGSSTSQWDVSPDNLRQTSTWTPLESVAVTTRVALANTRWLDAELQFIFDKSGSDPRCTVKLGAAAGGTLSGVVETPNAIDYENPLTYCIALTGGLRCIISQNVTTSSRVEVAGGVRIGWVTASLARSWEESTSVSIVCTSPELQAGQRYYAYPTGTKYRFRTGTTFFGESLNAADGSAFQVDGGVACSTVTPEQGRAL
ncbi:hypothetical protein KXS11_00785 [Plantibacter flavus]|uniref:hypothetical protein n=1 Tax=Plantibacter flavus TaxID=150123 RepID=UPI003F14E00B